MLRRASLASIFVLGCSSPPEPELVTGDRGAQASSRDAALEVPITRFDVPKPPPPPAIEVAEAPPSGTVLAHGGGPLRTEVVQRFAELCGPQGKLVLIPTASERADRPSALEKLPEQWRKRVGRVDVLHTLDRDEANDAAFARPLDDADCVWLGGGAQGRLRDAYVGTRVHEALQDVLRRGGAVGGYSAGAAILSGVIIRRGNPDPVEDEGFGLLREVVIDQHFVAREREPRLLAMLERHPELVGYGIDEDAALVLHHGRFEVIGNAIVRRCTQQLGCTTLRSGSTGEFP